MKYLLFVLLLASHSAWSENESSYRFKYSALHVNNKIDFESGIDIYSGDFLLVSKDNQKQSLELTETLSVIELGMSYNLGYLIFSTDYAFNISGDKPQEGDHVYSQEGIDDPIFDRGLIEFANEVTTKNVEYSSAQASVGVGNGYLSAFAGYRINTNVSNMIVDTYMIGLGLQESKYREMTLDSVLKGPFVGVSFMFDIGESNYLASKVSVTQYESGHLILSDQESKINQPMTGQAVSFSTKYTGKSFFIGVEAKSYKSDEADSFSSERTEFGINFGMYWI